LFKKSLHNRSFISTTLSLMVSIYIMIVSPLEFHGGREWFHTTKTNCTEECEIEPTAPHEHFVCPFLRDVIVHSGPNVNRGVF
jgi:hypothetical protein